MTVKLKLIYLICMVCCVLITLSTVSAVDIDGELISSHDSAAKLSQSESSITNLNEKISDIEIYSEDQDCVDSVNGLSNLNSIDGSYSDLNSNQDYNTNLNSNQESAVDLNSINSDEKSLKSSLSAIDSSNKSYENDLNDELFENSISNDDSYIETDLKSVSNEKNTLKSNSLGAGTSTFADLQAMINNAASGSTINLGGKTFIGNGTSIVIKKPLTIDGGSINNKAILDGRYITTIINTFGDNVHFINCILMNDLNGSIKIYSNNSSVKNCDFVDNNWHLYVSPLTKNFLVENCNFTFGHKDEGATVLIDAVNSTVRNCNFINNTVYSDNGSQGYGGALQIGTFANATNIGYVINCNFINNTVISNHNESHGGALCFRPGIKVSNCNFINNYCNKIGGATTLHADGEIVNCTFINNTAGEYGGAISTGFEWDDISVNITNCTFINNSAPMGGAIQIKGHNVKVTNSKFEGNKANESEGGAVFIVGNYALIINSTFTSNFAETVGAGILINGSDASVLNSSFDKNIADYGAAVYVIGPNANLFSSNFTNHNVKNGSVYIEGINTYVYDSIFERNYGESGAGLYIEGSNATVISTDFSFNNASEKGGAVYIEGSEAQLILSNFLNNNAIPDISEMNVGLGGAIYIKGDNNLIDSSTFNYNTARNGSAIYTDGLHMTLSNDDFDRNQAWSYSLKPDVDPAISYFNESDILINLTLIGGNNIANAIYNTASMNQIYFYNVSYISSKGEKTTGSEEIHPVNGAQNSNDGSLLYQDDREDNQLVNVIIYRDSEKGEEKYSILSPNSISDDSSIDSMDGGISLNSIDEESISPNDIIFNQTFRTGILGDISFNLSDYIDEPLEPGKYLIYSKHYEDDYYKGISDDGQFEILPLVDLAVNIGSSRVNIDFNKTVKYTIKVNNSGPNDASEVKVNAVIPEGLAYQSSSPSIGSYDPQTGIWTIGNLESGDNQTLTINVQTNKGGLIDFPVNVSSIDEDTDPSNNFNNKTIRVLVADLAIEIKASQDSLNYGDNVDWNITVRNNGPNNASKLVVSLDQLDESLIYLGCSNDTFNETSFKWEIPSLMMDEEVSLVISTKANASNKEITLQGNVSADTYDPIQSNNIDSDMVNILPLCDLITKVTVSNSSAKYNDTVDWIVIVSNDGPDDASDVVVSLSDLESLGAIILDADDDSFDKDSLEWIIGDLPSGESASLSICTQIAISNSTIPFEGNASSKTLELNYENNHDEDSLAIGSLCDLIIDLALSNSTVNYGDIVDCLLVVSNDGPDDAFDVVVSLSDLESLGLVVLDSDDDSYNKDSYKWNIGDLASGKSATLNIKTKTNKSNDNLTVLADVTTSTFELNEENNHDEDSLAINPICDLIITIIPDNNPANVGDTVNWIINVTNIGPDNASDVNVLNSLPEGLEYIVYESSKGEVDETTDDDGNKGLNWNVGDLGNNESAFLVISTQTLEEGTLMNDASASSSTPDMNQSNNFDSAIIDVLPVVPDENNTGDNESDPNNNSDGSGDDSGSGSDGSDEGSDGSGDGSGSGSDGSDEGSDDESNGSSSDGSSDGSGDGSDGSSSDGSSDGSGDGSDANSDGYYDGYYDDYPWNDYNFLDDSNDKSDKNNNSNKRYNSNGKNTSKDNSNKTDSSNNKSKGSPNNKSPIDISSKKTGNPLIFAILSISTLFYLRFRKN